MDLSAPELERKAFGGDAHAQYLLSLKYENDGEHSKGLRWLRRAVESGSTEAVAALGRRFITKQPFQVDEGVALCRRAAADGHSGAAHLLAMLTASGVGVGRNLPGGYAHLQRAAALGSRLAQDAAKLLAGNGTSVDWDAWLAVPPARVVCAAPRVFAVEGFVSPEVCNWMMERARPNLARAKILDPHTAELRFEPGRTNTAAYFDYGEMDFVFQLVRERMERVTGLPIGGMEAPSVFHYDVGQEFGPHYDFLEHGSAGYGKELAPTGGQRVLTFLIYLNDGYEGGETTFPRVDLRHKGRTGDALFFWNVHPDGAVDRATYHAGLPPTRGEKWLFSQWVQALV